MRAKKWYVLFRFRHVDGLLQMDELDAVRAHCSSDVLHYAERFYSLDDGYKFAVEVCTSRRDIVRAKRLSMRAQRDYFEIPDWSRTEFIDWMCQPAYAGNQQRYMRN